MQPYREGQKVKHEQKYMGKSKSFELPTEKVRNLFEKPYGWYMWLSQAEDLKFPENKPYLKHEILKMSKLALKLQSWVAAMLGPNHHDRPTTTVHTKDLYFLIAGTEEILSKIFRYIDNSRSGYHLGEEGLYINSCKEYIEDISKIISTSRKTTTSKKSE